MKLPFRPPEGLFEAAIRLFWGLPWAPFLNLEHVEWHGGAVPRSSCQLLFAFEPIWARPPLFLSRPIRPFCWLKKEENRVILVILFCYLGGSFLHNYRPFSWLKRNKYKSNLGSLVQNYRLFVFDPIWARPPSFKANLAFFWLKYKIALCYYHIKGRFFLLPWLKRKPWL